MPRQTGLAWCSEGRGESHEEFWWHLHEERMERVLAMGMRPTHRSVGVGTELEECGESSGSATTNAPV